MASQLKFKFIGMFSMLWASLVWVKCRKDINDLRSYSLSDPSKSDSLALFNLLPTYQSKGYVLYLNDSLKFGTGRQGEKNFKFTIPRFLAFPYNGRSSTAHFKIFLFDEKRDVNGRLSNLPPSKAPSTIPFWEGDIQVPKKNDGTNNLFFFFKDGSVKTRLILTKTVLGSDPSPARFKLRIVNLGYDVSPSAVDNKTRVTFPVSVRKGDSSSIAEWESLAFDSVSSSKEFDYGSYQFRVFNTNSDTILLRGGFGNNVPLMFSPQVGYDSKNVGFIYADQPAHVDKPQRLAGDPPYHFGYAPCYSFQAGAFYTMYIVGDMYVINLDKAPASISPFAKIQFINACPDFRELTISFTVKERNFEKKASYGSAVDPQIVPSGLVDFSFRNSQNEPIYSGKINLNALENITVYLVEDLNKNVNTLRETNFISKKSNPFDPFFIVQSPTGLQSTSRTTDAGELNEQAQVNFLNLVPDAGSSLSFVYTNYQQIPTLLSSFRNSSFSYREIYNGNLGVYPFDYLFITTKKPGLLGDLVAPLYGDPARLSANLSFSRSDNLVGKELAAVYFPFERPGHYTFVVIGRAFDSDPLTKSRILIVKHSNYQYE